MAMGLQDLVSQLAMKERQLANAFASPLRAAGIALPPPLPGPMTLLAQMMGATGTPSRDELNATASGNGKQIVF